MQQTADVQAVLAFDQVVDWLQHFEALEDPRQAGKVFYPPDEILLLTLMAVLAGAKGWTDVATFGEQKLELLRRFAPFENGSPPHDRLGEVFAALDAEAFQGCFIAWTASVTKLGSDSVAVDGKTLRRTYQEPGARAVHMISASMRSMAPR